jgi:decaprenylphospho-beta-D-erythro-pentofuranosid-2-ulose 2-reductase
MSSGAQLRRLSTMNPRQDYKTLEKTIWRGTMKTILVIGATSAIATELIRTMPASYGFYLVGRSSQKCQELAEELAESCLGWWSADFTNHQQIVEVWEQITNQAPQLDEIFIAHGYLGNQVLSEENYDESRKIIETNLTSVIAWLILTTSQYETKSIKKIGVITSVAGDRGRPRNFTYGAAKGGLNIYLEGLRSVLWGQVEIHTFKLGPVDTPMTKDHSKNFSFTSVEKAAQLIHRGFNSRRRVHYVPGFWRYILWTVRSMPEPMFQRLHFLSAR